MADLLFLANRIPYPPDKGEKIRGWQMLLRLARSHRVHLAAFIDDPADVEHADYVRRIAGGEALFIQLHPRRARFRSLSALIRGEPLSCAYFHAANVDHWISRVVEKHEVRGAYVLSSSMAGYAMRHPALRRGPTILDMVDVDSDKYRQYATRTPVPMRWVYAREADRLGRHERAAALWFDQTLLVAPHETALFQSMAPESLDRIRTVQNGVDLDYFDPRDEWTNPFPLGTYPLVFTGRMDYAPNEDAAEWFARSVLPIITNRIPQATFWIVGANPSRRVRGLANLDRVSVTGRVSDIRPYLAHAAACVAPLRLARGVQNKVLEALAMARPVVATSAAAQALAVHHDNDLLVADGPVAFADAVVRALDPRTGSLLGAAGRAYVVATHRWEETLAPIDQLFANCSLHAHAG